nr:sulfite exporter TauE/SafE family protein [Saccharopolyspora erythraea]
MVPAALLGAVIGLCVGLLGAGGSILAVPALVYGAGQPLESAIPVSLAVVALSSLAGLLPRERWTQARWHIAAVFGVVGVPGAFAGTALGELFPQRWLMLGFAALMAVVAVRMLRHGDEYSGTCMTPRGEVIWRICLPKSAAVGLAVGVLTGLFGVGGGFVVVPAMSLLMGLPTGQAVATSLVVVFLNSAGGLLAHARTAVEVDHPVVLAFGCAAVVVALAAGKLTARLPARAVRRGFAALVLVVAAGVAVGAVLFPLS